MLSQHCSLVSNELKGLRKWLTWLESCMDSSNCSGSSLPMCSRTSISPSMTCGQATSRNKIWELMDNQQVEGQISKLEQLLSDTTFSDFYHLHHRLQSSEQGICQRRSAWRYTEREGCWVRGLSEQRRTAWVEERLKSVHQQSDQRHRSVLSVLMGPS